MRGRGITYHFIRRLARVRGGRGRRVGGGGEGGGGGGGERGGGSVGNLHFMLRLYNMITN